MALLVTVIAGDLGNVPILACLLFGGSSVGPRSRGAVFSLFLLSLVWFSFLVFLCFLGGLISLPGLAGFILGLALRGRIEFLLSLFKQIVLGIETHLQGSFFSWDTANLGGYSLESWPWPQPYWLLWLDHPRVYLLLCRQSITWSRAESHHKKFGQVDLLGEYY